MGTFDVYIHDFYYFFFFIIFIRLFIEFFKRPANIHAIDIDEHRIDFAAGISDIA